MRYHNFKETFSRLDRGLSLILACLLMINGLLSAFIGTGNNWDFFGWLVGVIYIPFEPEIWHWVETKEEELENLG